MDIIKAFKLNDDSDCNINIQGTIEDPLFQANQIGELLEIKKIRNTIKNFDTDEKAAHIVGTPGGKQEVTFLTEVGLYRLLGMSRKPIARTFQKWVANTIKEIRITGEYKLKAENELSNKVVRHKTLIESFKDKRVVYICLLSNYINIDDSDKSIYKIGMSNQIQKRINKLCKSYGPCILLNVFECNKNQEFEKFLLHHEDIIKHKYVKKIEDFNKESRETFLFDEKQYNKLIKLINKNISEYIGFNTQQIVELKKIEYKMKKLKKEKKTNKNDENEENEENEKIEVNYIRDRNNARSPLVQKYDPQTKELLETYDSIIDVVRQHNDYSNTGLKTAVRRNTIYKGFRWWFVDRDKEDIWYKIPKTFEIFEQRTGIVAMINLNQDTIVEVYESQKIAGIARKNKSSAAICKALKLGTMSTGHYWKFYDDCSDELKATYTKELPVYYKKNNKKEIEVLDPKTKKVIDTLESVSDVLLKYQMSRKTLYRVCEDNEIYKGFLFREKVN